MNLHGDGKLTFAVENIGGLYGRNEFSFDEGLNLITAPNAAGKSSLIHGLQALVLEERELSTKGYFLHSFEQAGRVELVAQDGNKWVRRINAREGTLIVGGESLHPEGKKANLFCIASEDNELLDKVKNGKPLRSTLLDFSNYKYYEMLGAYFRGEKQKADEELSQYKDQLAQLKSLYSQLRQKQQELEEYEKQRKNLPSISAEKIARNEEDYRKLTEANNQLMKVIHEIATTEGERQRAKNTLESYTDQEHRLRQEIGRFETEHPDVEQDLEKMGRQIQTWQSEIEGLKRRQGKVQDMLEDTNTNLTHYLTYGGEECFACGNSITPEQLRERQKSLERESKEIGDDTISRQEKTAHLSKQKQQLEYDWTRIRTDLRRRLNDASREIALLSNKVEKADKTLDNLLSQRQELGEKVKFLEEAVGKELRELLQRRREIDEKIARTDENIKTIKARVQELGDVRSEIDRLQAEISFLEQTHRYASEKAEEVKQAVKNKFNEQIAEVYNLLKFDQDFERIYLDDNFDIKIIRRFQGQKKTDSIFTLSRGEKETVGLVLMLAGREEYVSDFPMFIADETTFYDATRLKRFIEYISKRVPYTIVTSLVPLEKQQTLKIEHSLRALL